VQAVDGSAKESLFWQCGAGGIAHPSRRKAFSSLEMIWRHTSIGDRVAVSTSAEQDKNEPLGS
jgi:hypothetical protein